MSLPTEIQFLGPFSLHASKSGSNSLFSQESSSKPGIYLFTVPYEGKFVPFYVGMTNKSIAERNRAHLQGYLSGQYMVYDVNKMIKNRERVEIHKGSKNTEDFFSYAITGYKSILDMLEEVRIFYFPYECETKILKRIESGFIKGYKKSLNNFIENRGISINIAKNEIKMIPITINNHLLNLNDIEA